MEGVTTNKDGSNALLKISVAAFVQVSTIMDDTCICSYLHIYLHICRHLFNFILFVIFHVGTRT